MDDTMVVALFRHGITEDNKRRVYLGWSDSSICKTEEQRISPYPNRFDHYYTSDLQRCIQTSHLLFPRVVPTLVPEFRELNFGDWERCTYEGLKGDMHYQRWLNNFEMTAPPNGEHLADFRSRIQVGWHKCMQQSTGNRIAIITHGGVIRSLLAEFAPEPKDFWDWKIPYGAGYELRFTKEHLRRGEKCISLQEVPSTEKGRGSQKRINY
ncbi:histidine phosphatase family protein [Pseudalkalibacillus berkeleyi]|uniref:Histidine phosphatase family protein n=1 Tax=Pseudalkalibacillus berkeleyi TaxID=1069813 RepID=A0ABS9H0N2_9BACL|nr:histidine phosphatase family protein [Pseudalkalibacillus berkeleyi]MCF6137474.1 histidine phosphatase family protein [Pseudalkalibacillus berkeleyi]